MADLLTAFNADMAAQPQWVQIWLNVLVAVLALSIPFSFVRAEARWTLLGFILGAGAVMALYSHFGYHRILGLGHVIFWTPLLIYLLKRRPQWNAATTLSGKWIAAAVAVIAVSLIFDYVDVARALIGFAT